MLMHTVSILNWLLLYRNFYLAMQSGKTSMIWIRRAYVDDEDKLSWQTSKPFLSEPFSLYVESRGVIGDQASCLLAYASSVVYGQKI